MNFHTKNNTESKSERRENMSYMGEVITSNQNKYVALARALGERKQRQKNSLFRFDGVKLLCEAAKREVVLEFLLISEGAYDSVYEKAQRLYGLDIDALGCRIVAVTDLIFDKISEENSPEGVIAVAKYDEKRHRELHSSEITVENDERVLLLDEVRDPQNVGAILRTAAAFSVDRVIMGRDCADIYSAKTLRASMGAIFALSVDRVDSVSSAVKQLREKGRRVYAAALDERAERLGRTRFSSLDCVVIGNEGHGLSRETIDACDASVYIPMSDGVESLNAAVAASVLMWEFFGSLQNDNIGKADL